MRHSVELIKKLDWLVKDEDTKLTEASRLSNTPESTTKPYCLVLRSDGGTDRNPKHFSVKIATIFLMLSLDLDCLILEITARDVSHTNEVEGCMPVANLALQNQAFARSMMSEESEATFKSSGSGKMIREVIAKQDGVDKQKLHRKAWRDSLSDPIRGITDRFQRMTYCNEKTVVIEPASEEEIAEAWVFLQEKVDPTIDSNNLTKKFVLDNNRQLVEFLRKHVRSERYHLECRKCDDIQCKACLSVSLNCYLFFC
jgi:hypothetical protein